MAAKLEITTEDITVIVKGKNCKGKRYALKEFPTFNIETVCLKDGRESMLCGLCGGTGYRSGYEFCDGGRCWPCNNTGRRSAWDNPEKTVRMRLGKLRKDYITFQEIAKERAALEAKWAAEYAEWSQANADVVAYVDEHRHDSDFLWKMLYELENKTPLSEQQATAVRKIMAEAETQRYVGQVGDKLTVTGNVVKTLSGYGDFGAWYLAVVQGTGDFEGATFKFMGSAAAIRDLQGEEGSAVTIQATVKKHEAYDNTKQTAMQRPKLIACTTAA